MNATRPTNRRESQLSLHPNAAASWYWVPNFETAQSRFGKFKTASTATKSVCAGEDSLIGYLFDGRLRKLWFGNRPTI
jgi:hypothetical protein